MKEKVCLGVFLIKYVKYMFHYIFIVIETSES